jgi:hypothetical protein
MSHRVFSELSNRISQVTRYRLGSNKEATVKLWEKKKRQKLHKNKRKRKEKEKEKEKERKEEGW